jgi:hypothetical protein
MTPQPTPFRADSYCGLYCGACEVFNLYREGLEERVPANWEDLPQQLKNVIPPTSEISCTGCKTDLLSPGCQACVIRICASGKKVEACVICEEYPCQLVNERKQYITEHLQDVLPHIKTKFSQAERIKEVGYESWCEVQVSSGPVRSAGRPLPGTRSVASNAVCHWKRLRSTIQSHKSGD